jgi:hypothetical protein
VYQSLDNNFFYGWRGGLGGGGCYLLLKILNFLDGFFNSRGGWDVLIKFFFWMRVELPMCSHPADTPPRGLWTGQAGTIPAWIS